MPTRVRSVRDMNADTVLFKGVGFGFTAYANQATTYDYKFTETRIVDGMQMLCKTANFGDSITVQLVDKDNVLGGGSNVVLDTFVTDWYLAGDDYHMPPIRLEYGAEIYPNLYMRIIYNSTGLLNTVSVKVNLFAHLPLV